MTTEKEQMPGVQSACDPTLTRKEFIQKTIKRAAVAGALVAGVKVTDKFLVPPAYAQASGGGGGNGCVPTGNPSTDSICGITVD